MNTKILKVDSRDIDFHPFGSTTTVAPESNFGIGVPLLVEKITGIDCTALSTIKVGYSQKKILYDEDTLWNETPHTDQGADPRDTLSTAVKNGLYNVATKLFEKIWGGYFRADTGGLDAFGNTQSAMTLTNSSCTVATNWYSNWNRLQQGEVMLAGDIVVSEHDYVFLDWKIINGVTMAVIDAHLGYTTYMPREVYNAELAKWGCGAYMPTTQAIQALFTRNLLSWISDMIKNVFISLSAIQKNINLFITKT